MFNLFVKYKYRITNEPKSVLIWFPTCMGVFSGKISVDGKKTTTSLAIQSFPISYVLETMLNY